MRMRILTLCGTFLVGTITMSFGAESAPSGLSSVNDIFQQTGKTLPGDVTKYSWPRSDLHVLLGETKIEPGLALNSWAAFKSEQRAGEFMVMGDLVLTASEVNPVIETLQQSGFQILGIHNHLIKESPSVIYVHYEGHGPAEALAKSLKDVLARTATPGPSKPAEVKLTAAEQANFGKVQEILGRKGNIAGRILQLAIPRKEKIEEAGMEIPPTMGMAISMNFQNVENQVATTGDFVLLADEVNPAIRELTTHGIEVTALHSHMLDEKPRLLFLHFWGVGSPEKIAEGLKVALSKVNAEY